MARGLTPAAGPTADLVAGVGAALDGEPGVAPAYVYGSVARGQATPLSDVDVAVVASAGVEKAERGALQRRLLRLLERRIPGQRVDVRFLDELPVANHVIASEGYRAPSDYADAFRSLAQAGVLSAELAGRLEQMARFRNLLVHIPPRVRGGDGGAAVGRGAATGAASPAPGSRTACRG